MAGKVGANVARRSTLVAVHVNQSLDPEIEAAVAPLGSVALDAVVAAGDAGAPVRPPAVRCGRPDRAPRARRIPRCAVRVHRTVDAAGAQPCLLSFHGGGLVIGSYDNDDAHVRSPGARRSASSACRSSTASRPRRRYPGALEDGYAALAWSHDHADELGIDPGRIGVRGISAGGGLAAALALLARDRGEYAVAFQLLDCPMLDDRQVTPSSQQRRAGGVEPRVERVRVALVPR